ncbi:hypothetical protein E4Z66_10370 [Aliishimia ponticola]|uniref:PEP-CTERM sorting domain-containing protein n=1 Tax=Aliishimia ponticola TaxID=2499833 RepID=A0A4S4NGM7_9RHOB|nr:hypothetical protein [Aliishimia ponticola]THH37311.1 hypothetical protein E4Z66_10370 [Aliishimia ponticola]
MKMKYLLALALFAFPSSGFAATTRDYDLHGIYHYAFDVIGSRKPYVDVYKSGGRIDDAEYDAFSEAFLRAYHPMRSSLFETGRVELEVEYGTYQGVSGKDVYVYPSIIMTCLSGIFCRPEGGIQVNYLEGTYSGRSSSYDAQIEPFEAVGSDSQHGILSGFSWSEGFNPYEGFYAADNGMEFGLDFDGNGSGVFRFGDDAAFSKSAQFGDYMIQMGFGADTRFYLENVVITRIAPVPLPLSGQLLLGGILVPAAFIRVGKRPSLC